MQLPYTFVLEPQTHVRGLFIVQAAYEPAEFNSVISGSKLIPPALQRTLAEDYVLIEGSQAACFFSNVQTPWCIVIFGSEPRTIRFSALHEIVHLADGLACNNENRARFIQYCYMAFDDDLVARLPHH